MFNVVLIAAIIVLVIVLFFVYSIIREHKKVLVWQKLRIAAEINTLENERKRIAGDLHDELGPMLSAIKLQINHNTVKHARATVLDINVVKKEKSILLKTKDDGVGFNYTEKQQASKGLGLMSLYSRAEVLGGQLVVNSQPGTGTAFEIEIPL